MLTNKPGGGENYLGQAVAEVVNLLARQIGCDPAVYG